MNLIRSMIAAAMLGLLAALGCQQQGGPPREITSDQPLRVVTTIQPLKLILRDLIDDDLQPFVTFEALLPPDQSPHGFEPSPGQVAAIQRADVLIINGLGLDDWAKRAASRGSTVLVFAEAVGIDAGHHHHHDHDHHHDCDHDHGPVDEHLWLDPVLVKQFAGACAAALSGALAGAAEHAMLVESLDAAAARFVEAADVVDASFRERLESFAGRRIVTHHNVFSRITDRYGLGEPIVLRPLAALEPTPGDLRRAIDVIRKEGITTIFIEPQFHPAAAERIRDETGVALIEIDPHGARATSWPQYMHELLDTLVEGMDGSKRPDVYTSTWSMDHTRSVRVESVDILTF